MLARQRLISNSGKGELALNSAHNLVSIPSTFGLGKMHHQDGRASNSKRACRHLPCNAMDMRSMMCNMYQ